MVVGSHVYVVCGAHMSAGLMLFGWVRSSFRRMRKKYAVFVCVCVCARAFWGPRNSMLHALVPDIISYSGAISACEHSGEWPVAIGLMADAAASQLALDVICYSSVPRIPKKSHFLFLVKSLIPLSSQEGSYQSEPSQKSHILGIEPYATPLKALCTYTNQNPLFVGS